SRTIASIQIDDIKSSATWSDAAFVFDGAIDTVHLNGLDLANGLGNGKPILHLRNTVAAAITPRWIHCVNCTIESRDGTAIRLDASRDFRFVGGYIATATVGVAVGSGAIDTDISHNAFANIGQQAVTIAGGSLNTLIESNTFDETGNRAH